MGDNMRKRKRDRSASQQRAVRISQDLIAELEQIAQAVAGQMKDQTGVRPTVSIRMVADQIVRLGIAEWKRSKP